MSDIFKEVDEDIRREQLRKLWNRFAPYVIGVAVLIVAGTAGYRGWEYWQERQAQTTGDRFIEAVQLSVDGQPEAAIAALETIVADGSGGYPALAGFRIAAEKATAGDPDGAVAAYDAIAARGGTPEEIRTLARLRAAMIAVDIGSFDDLKARIGDLATTGNPWRHTARELLGLSAFRAGDYGTAAAYFDEIANDQESPEDLKQRGQLIMTLINARPPGAAGGGNTDG
jgi:hypothetical protein